MLQTDTGLALTSPVSAQECVRGWLAPCHPVASAQDTERRCLCSLGAGNPRPCQQLCPVDGLATEVINESKPTGWSLRLPRAFQGVLSPPVTSVMFGTLYLCGCLLWEPRTHRSSEPGSPQAPAGWGPNSSPTGRPPQSLTGSGHEDH